MKKGIGIFVSFVLRVNVGLALQYNGVHDEELVWGTGVVQNYGVLNGAIQISDNSNVYIENYGQINSCFDYGANVLIEQQITGVGNLHKIENLTNYIARVNGANNLNMSELVNVAENANEIILENSFITIDGDFSNLTMPIHVQGNAVGLRVVGAPENWLDNDVALLSNITGTPIVNVVNNNSIYTVETELRGGTLYAHSTRQSDYSSATNNQNLNDYLNDLQSNNTHSEFTNALNSAENVETFLRSAVRLHPIKLMNVIKTINSIDVANSLYTADSAVYIKPRYIVSDDFSYYDARLNIATMPLDNLAATFGFNFGHIDYSDGYDKFSGTVYGGNFGARYDLSDYFAQMLGVFSYVRFDNADVFDGIKKIKSPHGTNAMITIDSGAKFNLDDVIELAPFVGARFDWSHILQNSDFDTSGRIGISAQHKTNIDENLYSVGLRTYAQTDKVFYAGIFTDALSSADGVAGGASIGALYDDMGVSFQFEINARMLF